MSNNAEIVYVQLDRDVSGRVEPQSDGAKFAKLTKAQLETVSETARDTGNALLSRLGAFEVAPSKIALEFGITAGGEVGVPFVTKGTLEAQFKITIEWSGKA